MSHSNKDAVGGHVGSWINAGHGGVMNYGTEGRRFAKKWNRREARREARATVAEGLQALEEDYQQALEDEREAFEYEMLYELGNAEYYDMIEEDNWERELAQDEAEEYETLYGSYYDDYGYDGYDDFYSAREVEHEEFEVISTSNPSSDKYSDSGESLGDILARMQVEGAR